MSYSRRGQRREAPPGPREPGSVLGRPLGYAGELLEHLRGLGSVEIVYTDLDGTLLGPNGSLLTGPDGAPSPRAAIALCRAAAAGITVVPVSGRAREQLWENARLLGLSDCICEAGAVIVRDDRVTYEWGECPRDLAATPHEAMVSAGAVELLLQTFAGDLRHYAPWHRNREGGHLFHGDVDVTATNALLAGAGFGWCYLVDNGASGGWPGRKVRAYHLLPRGVGKAVAVRDDLAARGLSTDQAIAVGDSFEDLTMASEVGTYVIVANGHGDPGPGVFRSADAMGHGFAALIDAILTTP